MDLSLARFEARLAAHRPHEDAAASRRAAVAAILRFCGDGPEVLLMQRARRPGDRWSGHVSFPGGGEESGDASLLATAIRETREEVGIDLESTARCLGRLSATRAVSRGQMLPLSITPFVFVQERGGEVVLGEEAEAVFWLPLGPAARGELDGRYLYRVDAATERVLGCWRYGRFVIWGLTYRMLGDILHLVLSD